MDFTVSTPWRWGILWVGSYALVGIVNEIRELVYYRDRYRLRPLSLATASLCLERVWERLQFEDTFLILFLFPPIIVGLYLYVQSFHKSMG